MQRLQLLEVLDRYKKLNSNSSDFTMEVAPNEARAINLSLIYFKAENIIDDYERDGNRFYIEGYSHSVAEALSELDVFKSATLKALSHRL